MAKVKKVEGEEVKDDVLDETIAKEAGIPVVRSSEEIIADYFDAIAAELHSVRHDPDNQEKNPALVEKIMAAQHELSTARHRILASFS